jgi:hypothetical protein
MSEIFFLAFSICFGVTRSVYNCYQRFAAWRSGGFLAQKFNRRTTLEPTTKLSYEALHPPLRQTAVVCCPSCIIVCLSVIYFSFVVRWLGGSFAKLGFSAG